MLERILPVIYTDPKNKLFQNFRRSPFFVPKILSTFPPIPTWIA
ncbi:hypothetical protein LEP1GSC173_0785 [Leptospira interrogans str. HAI1594]|uniref:Uncharacterized protein n=1 Tax=Leptospira interrogans serovar Copenhageni str. LT2050 TaxID=1001598 RepID=M3IF36_LEPIT|nr:hypothetical protein LEP1GSC117_4199 [Leptospira interrogans serovar Icterohaemorrhagiae str. Verdun LP]EKP76366.1 hypothetical protein LEP1GSC173_0785 [Leptospira interrogans str. HAI1594]EMG19337.1 hypothetical protein LEP1GSC150_2022 [Leptospira interrogans serovar Copenhageni str. LT2050]EMM89138.1 hypothetical protein LEP1GSC145_1022 [Leptospira interrogans serovar Djasiman str. LT1649]EMO19585.1 hypothetical protein LEP1GSC167_3001 [Leptospira interrogans serovar Copenhageni str. HAI01